jgi:MoaA/NifB/PqqE/SkfB family radical SAM enzyme
LSTIDLQEKLYTPKLRLENAGELSVLIDTDHANWIGVNEFGASILSKINGKTYDELVDELGAGFDNKNVFADKLKKFIIKCHKRGFLSNLRANGRLYGGRSGKMNLKSLHEMWIITNFDCNLRCSHCYTIDKVKSEKDTLSADEIKRIVDDARELGTEVFYFSGGEPFLREDIMELVAYVAARSKLILFTNGTLITKELAGELKAFRDRLIVQVSIEGHDEESNARIRNKGMFKRAMDGVKLLLEEGLMVGVSSTPVTATKESVPKLTDLLGRLNVNGHSVKYHHLIYLLNDGNAKKYPFTTLSNDELSAVFEKCCEVRKSLKKQKINKSLKIANEKIFEAYATNGPKKDFCGAGYTILAVDSKGHLYPCASTISKDEFDAGSLVDEYGKYVKGKLKELWHQSEKLKEVRAFSIERREGEPEGDLRFFHGGGCWCNMKDPRGAFTKEHLFVETYEEKTLLAIKKAAREDVDDDEITNKYPKIFSYMSRERIACAGMRRTHDNSDDGLDLGYCICFS